MGGNSEGIGNASVAAEFNFHADPEAAHVVVESARCPVTIVPWETCYKVRQSRSINDFRNFFGTFNPLCPPQPHTIQTSRAPLPFRPLCRGS